MILLMTKKLACSFFLLILFFVTHFSHAGTNLPDAITKPVPITELVAYQHYPKVVQQLISEAAILSKMNLTYLYGSADPKNKGMDCSGTIYYLLTAEKINDVPRSSDEMFNWVTKSGKLYRVTRNDFNSPEFSHLKPGDLLFWSGTYATPHNAYISHVMLYLGKNKLGERLMFGASDGRTYQGKKCGVSAYLILNFLMAKARRNLLDIAAYLI